LDRRLSRRLVALLCAVVLCALVVQPAAGRPGTGASPTLEHGGSVGAPAAAGRIQPGQLLVKVTRRAGAPGLARAAQAIGGVPGRALGHRTHLLAVDPGTEAESAAHLAADPAVEYAEPSYFRAAASHAAAEMGWGVRRLRAPAVWSGTTSATGDGARIAVIDSGVQARHPDLNGRVVTGYDAYGGKGVDQCGHGTAVAGVAAAAHDGSGLAGVAPEATIVPVKVLRFDPYWGMCGSGDAELINALYWVARAPDLRPHADIINLSLSGPGRSRSLREAVEYAAGKGILIVGASGNDGSVTVNYPAAYRDVISVGGVRRSGDDVVWWRHSSFGDADVVAAAKDVPVIQASTADVAMGRPCTVNGMPRTCADGTSFAAPHVAGMAALLTELHPELADLPPAARVRRLRQWITATANDVEGTRTAVDLRTGHGEVDAVDASAAAATPARTLLTWQTGGRILAPWRRLAQAPLALPVRFVATNGEGQGLAGRRVTFTTSPGGSVSVAAAETDSSGGVTTVLRSEADGRTVRVTATLEGGRSLPLEIYVLDRDDNVPGAALPSSPFRDSLNLSTDFDDVFRVRLLDGETVQARVSDVAWREDVAVYLHRGSTRDIGNPGLAPIREDSQRYQDNWKALKVTVGSDGVRYLHADGYGSYRMRWWIYSPRMLRNVEASPRAITPNGDGDRDRTTVTWRVMRAGRMNVVIRDAFGHTVARSGLGRVSDGPTGITWNGRNDDGKVVKEGSYRVVLRWEHSSGRISRAMTKVFVQR
jgi:subtilisin family serine protease